MGGFNIDPLSFDTSQHINEFVDNIISSLQLQILQSTRIQKNHKTLINNVFCSIPNFDFKWQYHNNFSRSSSTILFNI